MTTSALFISTLSEETALTQIIDKVPFEEFDEVYALDGGSQDRTVEILLNHNISVVCDIKKGEIYNVGTELTKC